VRGLCGIGFQDVSEEVCMIPNIEDVEVVEVGRMYMVPTVILRRAPKGLALIPVIGPLHEDSQFIGFPDHHWHPDRRFVTDYWLEQQGPNHWATIYTPLPRPRLLKAISKLRGEPVYTESRTEPDVIDGGRRRLQCRRLVGSFCNSRTETPPGWLKKLEPAYANSRLRDGHICPHRGISCRGVIAENDGVVCPGHGLKWNMQTGRLVSRIGQTFQSKLF
jgi:Rieske 2Fe-2S protein